ncbi:MAG: hypothetical protein EAX96_21410 [Candidatus Lokiarchaeota archaeon]|nr:hypothetical protein [Candidatus Lokiarchaeota archaeon]
MTIKISKDEIKEYEKLKVFSQLTLVKEKIKLFENKYGLSIEEFSKTLKKNEEDFETWDDYIEWKANLAAKIDLKKKLAEIENAKDIKII